MSRPNHRCLYLGQPRRTHSQNIDRRTSIGHFTIRSRHPNRRSFPHRLDYRRSPRRHRRRTQIKNGQKWLPHRSTLALAKRSLQRENAPYWDSSSSIGMENRRGFGTRPTSKRIPTRSALAFRPSQLSQRQRAP